jgi:hypothetical protein
MNWIAILIAIIVIYELIFGYFLNENIKGCDTCENFHVHPLYKDKKKAALLMDIIDKKITTLIQDLERDPEGADSYVKQLDRYNNENIYEISPQNIMKKTSFLRNKKTLILCLRKKETGELHDENTITFVILHELSHMMNTSWGHDDEFWRIFKYVLIRAARLNLYKPVDYSIEPIMYCGLKIEFSPLYSDKIVPINEEKFASEF